MKFVLPAMIIFMIFFIIPNLASFALGFTDWTIYNFDDMKFNGFDNFKRLFQEPNFWLCVKNTFFFAIVTVIGKNVVGFVMALIVNKTTKYNSLLRGMVFLPITISALVVAIIFQSIYNPTNGLLNSFLEFVGLGALCQDWLFDVRFSMKAICAMEIWQQAGMCMCIFLAGLQAIPEDYYEAAKIDGASTLQQRIYITIPLMLQSINVSLMLSIISGIKVFEQVWNNQRRSGGCNAGSKYLSI